MHILVCLAVTFTDYNVGRLLDELDASGLTDSTAIIFHSDHGFSLSEEGSKYTLLQTTLTALFPGQFYNYLHDNYTNENIDTFNGFIVAAYDVTYSSQPYYINNSAL